MMRAGLRKVGAPEDLIQVLEDPSREAITELMKVSDLIVATGSGQVVRGEKMQEYRLSLRMPLVVCTTVITSKIQMR